MRRFVDALKVSLAPWVVSRLLVGAAWALSKELSARAKLGAAASARVHAGLLGWDAGWYEAIARHGYGALGRQSLRFFPLFPLLGRYLGYLIGGPGPALVLVANVGALVGVALLVVLVRSEPVFDGAAGAAELVAWFMCLAPSAFTFVMGYAEGPLLMVSVGTFLALRRRRWCWAAALGVVAGLTRPLGIVLAVPAAFEVLADLRNSRAFGSGALAARLGAICGPVAGTGAYMAWVGLRFHDAFAPFSVQVQAKHRGSFADPVSTLFHDASLLAHGQHLGEALHLPWALLALGLCIIAFLRLPLSYAAFALAVLAIALSASNLDSFERYALFAFPLVLGAALVTRKPHLQWAVLCLGAGGLVAYSVLAFTGLYVP